MPRPIRPFRPFRPPGATQTTLWSGPRPVADAPIRPDERFPADGVCLLAPGIGADDWALGFWDGAHWFNAAGDQRLSPRVFLLLPPLDSL